MVSLRTTKLLLILNIILLAAIYFRPESDMIMFYDSGDYYINKGLVNNVHVNNQYVVLGKELANGLDHQQIGLVRIKRLQTKVSELEIIDFNPNYSLNENTKYHLVQYDANFPVNNFSYGQIVKYDGNIATVKIHSTSEMDTSEILIVLGQPVTDLTFQGNILGRTQIGKLKIVRIDKELVEATRFGNSQTSINVGDFVKYQKEFSEDETRGNINSLSPFYVFRDFAKSNISFRGGYIDLSYGYNGEYLEVGYHDSISFGHIVNLGNKVDFDAVHLNTDRSRGGRIFEGLNRDPMYFNKHSFCLLGSIDDIIKVNSTSLLNPKILVDKGDVLIIRSVHFKETDDFIENLVKLKILSKEFNNVLKVQWDYLYKRDIHDPDPAAPVEPEPEPEPEPIEFDTIKPRSKEHLIKLVHQHLELLNSKSSVLCKDFLESCNFSPERDLHYMSKGQFNFIYPHIKREFDCLFNRIKDLNDCDSRLIQSLHAIKYYLNYYSRYQNNIDN